MHWDKIIIFLILESVMGYHNMDNFARIINGQNAAHGQFPYQVFTNKIKWHSKFEIF